MLGRLKRFLVARLRRATGTAALAERLEHLTALVQRREQLAGEHLEELTALLLRTQLICENHAAGAETWYGCKFLEGGLDLAYFSLRMCCGFNESPMLCEYRGGPVPFEQMIAVRDDLRRRLRNGLKAGCWGCPHLQKKAWVPREYLFDVVNIHNFTRCNLKCVYCFTQRDDPNQVVPYLDPQYDLLPLLEAVLQWGGGKGLAPRATVCWTGGEPVLHREFGAVTNLLADHGAKIDVFTNATLLSPDLEAGLGSRRVRSILCSVDAGTRETYLRVKGGDYFEAVWRHLARYAALAAPQTRTMRAKYLFIDENSNRDDILGFVHLCRQSGIQEIVIDTDVREVQRNNWIMPPRFVAPMGLMVHEALKNGIPVGYTDGLLDVPRIKCRVLSHVLADKTVVDEELWREHLDGIFPAEHADRLVGDLTDEMSAFAAAKSV